MDSAHSPAVLALVIPVVNPGSPRTEWRQSERRRRGEPSGKAITAGGNATVVQTRNEIPSANQVQVVSGKTRQARMIPADPRAGDHLQASAAKSPSEAAPVDRQQSQKKPPVIKSLLKRDIAIPEPLKKRPKLVEDMHQETHQIRLHE
jgi:flagellar biosynthesis GTPase FlhF